MNCLMPFFTTQTSLPDQQQSSPLNNSFASAESCLQRKAFRNCYEYLATIIKSNMFIAMTSDSMQQLFAISHRLQRALFDEHIIMLSCISLIRVDHESLVQLLLPFLHISFRIAISFAGRKFTSLNQTNSEDALKLKIEYLEQARIVARETYSNLEDHFIIELGKTYLHKAKLLPLEDCFEKGFGLALLLL